eukprot:7375149-Lingulodinium_polyedra.AAC.1
MGGPAGPAPGSTWTKPGGSGDAASSSLRGGLRASGPRALPRDVGPGAASAGTVWDLNSEGRRSPAEAGGQALGSSAQKDAKSARTSTSAPVPSSSIWWSASCLR